MKGNGKLGSSESVSAQPDSRPSELAQVRREMGKLVILVAIAVVFLVIVGVSGICLVLFQTGSSEKSEAETLMKPTLAISRTCKNTQYPNVCIKTLLDSPGSKLANEQDLVQISLNTTLKHIVKSVSVVSAVSNAEMDGLVRMAYEDCMELLQESKDHVSSAINATSAYDVMTWLSAALTNHETCADGFAEVVSSIKSTMEEGLQDLSKVISNSLAIYGGYNGNDLSGVPIENRRRNLLDDSLGMDKSDFPKWLTRKEKRLLQLPVERIQPDIVVAKNGWGKYRTISEAIKAVPEHSSRRFIIYVRAGRYEEENLKVGRKKKNVMIIGDGRGKTVITGGKSVVDRLTTFRTATFAATGSGFIARDITFQNYAGPQKHQAVALRIGADHAVIFRCSILGYQDTLYVHSQRQFYRECNIHGTIDFIFGNAAVVFQKCDIISHRPLPNQKNTITAQNRKDPNQNTGISIHNCRILAAPDLIPVKGIVPTYLGRPWKMYSRVVYMMSYMGDHVSPQGWLEWFGNFALDTLYYGEYMNYGPGAATGKRVQWRGFRTITSAAEAARFTVARFIYGSSWLPSTGVVYVAGLRS